MAKNSTKRGGAPKRTATKRGAVAPARSTQSGSSPRGAARTPEPSRTPAAAPKATGAAKAAGTQRAALPLMPILVALAAVVTIVISLRMTLCAPQAGIVAQQVEPQGISMAVSDRADLYKAPLDWSGLSRDANGYRTYQVGGKTVSRLGIDVSEHNTTIDWEQVKEAGIDFAYVRIGYRGSKAANIVEDSHFAKNLASAKAAGLDTGVYFFSQAVSEVEAREEADFVTSTLDGASLEYPIAFDMEPARNGGDRISGLSTDQMTAVASAFCRQCTNNGYRAVVYGNQYDLTRYNLAELMEYGFWFAEYVNQPSMNLNFRMWQFTSEAEVPGVEGKCDLNLDLTPAIEAVAAAAAGAEGEGQGEKS